MVTNSRYDYKNHNHKHPQKNHPIHPDLTVLVAQGHLAGLHGVVHRVHLLVLLQLPTHRWAQLRVKHFPNLILPMSKTFLEILPKIVWFLVPLEEQSWNFAGKSALFWCHCGWGGELTSVCGAEWERPRFWAERERERQHQRGALWRRHTLRSRSRVSLGRTSPHTWLPSFLLRCLSI